MGQNLIVRGTKIEDARTRVIKKRALPSGAKKRKLSRPLSVSMTRLSQPIKQQFRTEHCCRFEDGNERKTGAVRANKGQQKEKTSSRLVKSQREISGGELKGIFETFTNVSEARKNKRKARKPDLTDLEIHQFPLPVVTIDTAKCRSKTSSNDIVLPPIETPSR
jgi:hypothetical protein